MVKICGEDQPKDVVDLDSRTSVMCFGIDYFQNIKTVKININTKIKMILTCTND